MKAKEKLKQYLADNGLRQNFFAKKLNITNTYLNMLLHKANAKPSIGLAVMIEQFTKKAVRVEDWVDQVSEDTEKRK